MQLRACLFLGVFVLAACGSGGVPHTSPTLAPTFTPTFNLKNAVGTSVKVTLISVNGRSVTPVSTTTTIACNPSCAGPAVLGGNDVFDITVSDAQNNVLTHAQTQASIHASSVGPFDVDMLGVVGSIGMTGFAPQYFADNGYLPAAITIAAKDADGNPITGTFDTPITLSGIANGTAYFISDTKKNAAGQYASVVSQIRSASDPLYFYYSSQATAPTMLTATSGNAQASFAFNPVLSAIRIKDVNGVVVPGTGPITIQAPATSVGFYVDENGYSDFGQHMIVASNSCSGTLQVSQQPTPVRPGQNPALPDPKWGTYYVASQSSSGAAATSCSLTLTDGLGQNQKVDIVWKTS